MEVPTSNYIDLHLPSDKAPSDPKSMNTISFSEAASAMYWSSKEKALNKKERNYYGGMPNVIIEPKLTAAVGTKDPINYNQTDTGLFGTIYEAWANHLNVRTCPEDWWLPVITRVSTLVDNNANSAPVKKYFVNDQGKRNIDVELSNFSIYDTDYTDMFNRFAEQINQKITVPGYVDTITASFSTTTPEQLIGSQITIMKSFEKYFSYKMAICGCGIKGVEMSGTEEDWKLLITKLTKLRELLAPIESTLKIAPYFDHVLTVYNNLLKTFLREDMDDWWSKVLMDVKGIKYGGSGMSRKVDAYNGWIAFFCSGKDSPLLAQDLAAGKYDELSCLTNCPMKIEDRINRISDDSTLLAGILGFKLHKDTVNGVPSLQPVHGWALLLTESSPLRHQKKSK